MKENLAKTRIFHTGQPQFRQPHITSPYSYRGKRSASSGLEVLTMVVQEGTCREFHEIVPIEQKKTQLTSSSCKFHYQRNLQ